MVTRQISFGAPSGKLGSLKLLPAARHRPPGHTQLAYIIIYFFSSEYGRVKLY